MSIWHGFAAIVDNAVDGTFAEPVELYPYTMGSYSTDGVPDPTREVIVTTGIYVQPGAAVTGEGGTQGGGFDKRVVVQDVWLSITDDKIGALSNWKKGDLVYWPERDELFEIAWPDSSATGRPNIHLVRRQDSELEAFKIGRNSGQ